MIVRLRALPQQVPTSTDTEPCVHFGSTSIFPPGEGRLAVISGTCATHAARQQSDHQRIPYLLQRKNARKLGPQLRRFRCFERMLE
jgi:hypothetical protein